MKSSLYQRLSGTKTFTFDSDAPQLKDAAEALAVQATIVAIVTRRPAKFNKDADRAFRRWLGFRWHVEIDMTVNVDVPGGERIVLMIARRPRLFDFKQLHIRVVRDRNRNRASVSSGQAAAAMD